MTTERELLHVQTLTLSDTRTRADDEGGELLGRLLKEAGYKVHAHQIVREDLEQVRDALKALIARPEVDAVVTTGGTGLSPRDRTFDALTPLIERPMVGFGEAFRRLSFDAIGARALLSNALGGIAGGKVILAVPGSLNAIRLAVPTLIAPMLAHAVDVARGRDAHGPRR